MNGEVSYNANDLQNYDPITRVGIITNKIKHTDQPDSAGDLVPLASSSDSTVPTNEYISKSIMISGTISGSTQADLDDRIDTFKSYFNKRNKSLDIQYSSGIRRYTVMKVNGVSVDRQNIVLWASFTVEFLCKPFGTSISSTVISDLLNQTAASHTITPTIGGSAPYQLPIITITIDAKTGTGDFLQVSNDTNGQQIILTGLALAVNDIVIIDALKHKVTRNGIEVDYSGTFIELEPGAQSFTITDGWTTRTKDIRIEYFKRYF